MNNEITAIILAGGKSSRMKRDKAFLRLGVKTIIEELTSRIKSRFSNLLIIANDSEKYLPLGIKVVADIIPHQGPLGGIYTGLIESKTFHNFVFACDAPFVNLEVVDFMITKINDSDVIVPQWRSRLEPLHAIYSKNCIAAMEAQLEKGDRKIINFLSHATTCIVEQKAIEKFNINGELFSNINTPEDYDQFSREEALKTE